MSDILHPRSSNRFLRVFQFAEEWVGILSLLVLMFLPVSDFLSRFFFHFPIEASLVTSRNLVLYVAFFGAMLTAREGQHLSIATFVSMFGDQARAWINTIVALFAVTFATAFTWGATSLFLTGFSPKAMVGPFPAVLFIFTMPFGLFFITLRFALRAPISTKRRWIAATGLLFGTLLAIPPFLNVLGALGALPSWSDAANALWSSVMPALVIPGIVLSIALAFAGLPLFVVLGAIAWFVFAPTGGAMETISNEGYALLTDGSMPTIPLFTLVGFILAEGKAAERLIRMFRAWFGWLPGGLIFVTVLVSAFFTTFTGASGVTILALGMIMFLILTKNGYSAFFAMGLLTASGSIGILFPPSLPIIIYGGNARISVVDMFLGGIGPGLLMVVAMTALGVFAALKTKVPRVAFDLREALSAAKAAFFDLLLPILIIAVYFSGWMDLTETAAMAAIYAIVSQVFILRDLKFKDLYRAMVKALVIMGGILIVLALARGLAYYIIDTQLPQQLAAWMQANVKSPLVFLLALNAGLLVVGMFMDIYSAILVVAPLIIPLGAVFGIDPVHLGIIFLVNMEIGFLTPPVGLNLYLAAYVFKRPIGEITRSVLPFLAIQLGILVLVTYVPWLSTGLVQLVRGGG